MRAFAITDASAAPAVTEVPDPSPGAGEVLVRVAASSVNGFDAAVAAGMLQGMMEHRYPLALGKDFAGTVESLGEGALRFAVGDRVFGVVMKPYLGDGGLGELVAVGEQYGVEEVPAGLEMPVAGALGLAGTAAFDAIQAAGLGQGKTVLISGATGGVGAIAVQYAHAIGATVIATARPGGEDDFVRGLGAQHTVDFTGDVSAQVRAIAADGVDAVLHLAGDAEGLVELLAEGGRLVSTLGVGQDQHPAATAVMADPNPATLRQLASDVSEGRIRVPIQQTYSLLESEQALADYRAGTLGKLAVSMHQGGAA